MVFTISLVFFEPIDYPTILTIYGTVFGLGAIYFADINQKRPQLDLLIRLDCDLKVLEDGFLYLTRYSYNNELWYSFDFKTSKSSLAYKNEAMILTKIKSYMNLDLEFVCENYGVKYYKPINKSTNK